MSSVWLKVLWVIMGVLLIIAGVFALVNPDLALGSLVLLLGLAVLLAGLADIAAFIKFRGYIAGADWILADGIFTVLMSVFILFDQAFTAVSIPLIFGMWLIFRGITAAISSFDIKKLGSKCWAWFFALGIVLLACGIASFVKPVAAALTIGIIVGVAFIIQGVVIGIKGLFLKRLVK